MNPRMFRLPLAESESARLYWELARRGAFCVGERRPWRYERLNEEELTALAVMQSRYDPRLMAVLADYLAAPRRLDPLVWKRVLRQTDALPAACVIGEFALEATESQEVRDLFHYLAQGVRPAPTQLYYRGLYPYGGRKVEEAIEKPLWGFKKWGFLAADPPLLKEKSGGRRRYLYDQTSRRQILRDLAGRREPFRLRDYLREVGHSVSRQQALKDLQSAPWVRRRGRCKGAYYLGAIFGEGYKRLQ